MGVGDAIYRLEHKSERKWSHLLRIEKVLDEELVRVSLRSIDRRRRNALSAPVIKTIAANGLIDLKRYRGHWVPAMVSGKGNKTYLGLIAPPDIAIDLLSWFHIRENAHRVGELYKMYAGLDCLAPRSQWASDKNSFCSVNDGLIRLTSAEEGYHISNGNIDIDLTLPQAAMDGIHHLPVRRIVDSILIPPQTIAVSAFARQGGTRIQYDVETIPLEQIFGQQRHLVTRKQGQRFTVRDPVSEGIVL